MKRKKKLLSGDSKLFTFYQEQILHFYEEEEEEEEEGGKKNDNYQRNASSLPLIEVVAFCICLCTLPAMRINAVLMIYTFKLAKPPLGRL